MAEFLVFVTVLAIVIYLFNRSRKSPKELENIPHFSGIPLLWAYLRNKHYDEIGDIAVKATKGHDIYVSTIASFKQVAITSPDYAKALLMESEDNAPKYNEYPPDHFLPRFFGRGLAFANGDRWRFYRKLANPAFNKALYPEIAGEPVLEFLSFIEKNSILDRPADIYDFMQRLTLEVLGKLVFGHRFDCFDSEEIPELIKLYKYIISTIEAPHNNIFPWLCKLPLESNRRFYSSVDKFDEFIYGLIKRKRKEIANQQDSKNDREDLLTIILKVMEQEGITSANIKELRDDMINYFVAGHDTTSMALSASFYYLARDPEIQAKAREEVISAMGDKPMTIPSSEQLKELKYIGAIIKESLRVHPPAPILTFRNLANPVKIGPYTLPAKTLCSVNAYQIHHDPRYWDNPKQYNPERFLKNNEKRHPYAWIPFSAGPRNCVGQNYTLMAQKVIIAMTLLKYDLALPENSIHKEKLILEPNFLVLKPVDLKLTFAERN